MTDLTEQWKKGELPEGWYWVKRVTWSEYIDMLYYTSDIFLDGDVPVDNDKIIEVLAPVPSYDELQNMNKAVNECMAANIKLVEQNSQLKELLKECSIANTALVSIMDWLRKSTIPEQRESCAKLFEKTQELQKQLDEALK